MSVRIKKNSDGVLSVTVTGAKKAKGLPKRTKNPARRAKYNRYLGRATCFACSIVFRSPKYKADHVASGHVSRVGVNSKRSK